MTVEMRALFPGNPHIQVKRFQDPMLAAVEATLLNGLPGVVAELVETSDDPNVGSTGESSAGERSP